MLTVFFTSFTQVFSTIVSLGLLVFVGWLMVRRWRVGEAEVDLLVRVLVDVIVPAFMFYALMKDFDWTALGRYIVPLGAAAALTLGGLALGYAGGWAAGLRRDSLQTTAALTGFANNLFIPLPLALILLPPDESDRAAFFIGLMLLVIGPMSWSVRIWMIQHGARAAKADRDGEPVAAPGWRDFLRTFLNMPTIGTLTGMICAAPPIRSVLMEAVPLTKALQMLGQAITPMAMLLLGALLAKVKPHEGFSLRIVGVSLLVKLLVLPALALAVLLLAPPDDSVLGFVIMMEAAAPSAVTTAVVGRRYAGRANDIAVAILVITLGATATMPFFLALLQTTRH